MKTQLTLLVLVFLVMIGCCGCIAQAADYGPLAGNPTVIDVTKYEAMRDVVLYSMANAPVDEIVDNFLALLVGPWPKTNGQYSASHTVNLATREIYLPAIIDTARPGSFSSILLYKGSRNAARNGSLPKEFQPWMLESGMLSAGIEIQSATKQDELRERVRFLGSPFVIK